MIKAKSKMKPILLELIGLVMSGVIFFPLYMVLVNSFKTSKEAFALGLTLKGASFSQALKNYMVVFTDSKLHIAYISSAAVTIGTIAATVFFAAMMAFVIQRRKQAVVEFFNLLIMAGMILPASIVVQYWILRLIGLNNTYPGIILVYTAGSIPFSVFLFVGFFKGIPKELDESAVVDGCRIFRMFFQIIFPLIKPATVTVVIITGMSIWNDFAKSIYLMSSSRMFSVVTTIFSFYGMHASDWNYLFADITLISLPIIILYLAMQKYIISGMVAGSVKG